MCGKGDRDENKSTQEPNQEKAADRPERKYTMWGNLGLVEYNQEKQIWECRIENCEMQINTSRGMTRRRKIHRPEHYFGPNRQEMTCPYCSKTMSAAEILVVPMETHPQGGSRNIEICTQIHAQDTPRDNWAKKYYYG